jgi:hypothetical protein
VLQKQGIKRIIGRKKYMVPWPSGQAEVCNTFQSGSTPLGTSKKNQNAPKRGVFFVLFCHPELDSGSFKSSN